MEKFSIFKHSNYKAAVKAWIQGQPKAGYGQFRRLAGAVGMGTVMVSQIFNGDRDLSVEHGYKVARFMFLSEAETKYFLLLVEHARASSPDLKNFFTRQIDALKAEGTNLKTVLSQDRELSETEKATFHSNWTYSAIRLLTSIERFSTMAKIADELKLPPEEVHQILKFLATYGLIVQNGDSFELGPQRTHLERQSPFILARQKTWRTKAFEQMDRRSEKDLFYTGPMSTSKKLIEEFRIELNQLLKSLSNRVADEKPSDLFCLNIDLFQITSTK